MMDPYDFGYTVGTWLVYIFFGVVALMILRLAVKLIWPVARALLWPFVWITKIGMDRAPLGSKAAQTRLAYLRREWEQMRPRVAPAVLMRDNWMCQAKGCGKTLTTDTWSIDHTIPLSKGGDNSFDNLQAMCRRCNSSKGARLTHQMTTRGASWNWTRPIRSRRH